MLLHGLGNAIAMTKSLRYYRTIAQSKIQQVGTTYLDRTVIVQKANLFTSHATVASQYLMKNNLFISKDNLSAILPSKIAPALTRPRKTPKLHS
jgi:hypothetical protein